MDGPLLTWVPGDPWSYGPVPGVGAGGGSGRGGHGDTTQISVADEARNLVSLTQTASNFMVPGTGVMMNLGMKWFDPGPGHPNSIGSGKRLMMNMSPLVMLSGAGRTPPSGAGRAPHPERRGPDRRQPVDYEIGIQDAVSAPKLDCSTAAHPGGRPHPRRGPRELRRRGHPVQDCHEEMGFMSFARPNGIVVDDERGILRAGSYPYFHSVAAGL